MSRRFLIRTLSLDKMSKISLSNALRKCNLEIIRIVNWAEEKGALRVIFILVLQTKSALNPNFLLKNITHLS
jgi:hypothetical protein